MNLSTDQAAARLGVASITLRKWRVKGGGPRFCKLGRRVVYKPADLERFEAEHEKRSTVG